jgi:hypothetical protein
MPAILDKIAHALHMDKGSKSPTQSSGQPAPATHSTASTKATTAFDPEKVTVIFVLGGPGAGEALCTKIVV